MKSTRRSFIERTLLTSGAVLASGFTFSKPLNPVDLQDKKPLADELVHEFVLVSHGNFAKVKELFEKEPALLNASWDWGNGDFETGLNAAGHTGQTEIAEFLIAKGARMDIFCAAMLGKLAIVKAILADFPHLKTSKGPHGLMLLHHADKGGEKAQAVLAYLREIGAT